MAGVHPVIPSSRHSVILHSVILSGDDMLRTVLFAIATITQAELVQHTQELMDAVTAGNPTVFVKYYAADALFFDEKGRNMTKAQLVADITPLPKGYSGEIKVVHPQSRIIGNTAILSYDADEVETIWDQ